MIIDMMETSQDSLRTTEAQTVQKLKTDNEPRPKFTGS